MPLAAPIKISEEALLIQAGLKTWTDKRGGITKLVANLSHLWEELLVVSDKPRLLICYVGENSRGGENVMSALHRVDRQWQVIVVRGHGFKNVHAEKVGDAEAFLDCIEDIRDLLRSMLNISEEFPVEYRGIKPMPQLAPTKEANVFLDAQAIEFTTANDIPAIVNQDPGGAPVE